MYAVIKTGGKQYKVQKGDVIEVELLANEEGSDFAFDNVLLIGNEGKIVSVGNPTVEGAQVKAKLLSNGKADKVSVFKMKRRKSYRRLQGHRQKFSSVEILDIVN